MSRQTNETDFLVQEFPELPYDRYKIVQNIGKGAFSIVYLAYTPEYHRRAIKRIRLTSKPNQLMREIEFLRKLEGKENIVQVKEIRFSPTVSQTSVITNFCDSDDFKAVIYDYTPRDIHNYMKALLTSLAHCEKANILHRDVKPGNFLHVKATNEALLIDFGLAQTVREAEEFPIIRNRSKKRIPLGRPSRKPGDLPYCGPTNREQSKFQPLAPQPHSGTHGYRAPEILHAVNSQGPKIDTWSAGVIMIQMLTGKTSLFRGTPTTDLYELTAIRAIIGTDRFIQGSGLLGADFSLTAGTPNPQHIPLEELTAVLNPDLFIVLPPAAYDLCRRLLAFDPAHRLSATEALKHPFLSCDARSIPNIRRHPPELELSTDINGYKNNITKKARGIVARAGIPFDTAMNIQEEYTSAVPHTELQALPKEHRKLVDRLLYKYKTLYYQNEYDNMLRYGVGLDRGYIYDRGTLDVIDNEFVRESLMLGGVQSQMGNLSMVSAFGNAGYNYGNYKTYRGIQGIPSTCGIFNLSQYESIKLKPVDLASTPGYSYTPSTSPTMASISGRYNSNQGSSNLGGMGGNVTSEQEWLKFQQELEFNNRNKEIFEASVRFSGIRRRLDPWIVPLKLLDKELFVIQKRVREAAEDYRLALFEMGIVKLEDDEASMKPNPNNPRGVSDHERVIERIIEMRARLGEYPCCDWFRDELAAYKKKYGAERVNELSKNAVSDNSKNSINSEKNEENNNIGNENNAKEEMNLEKEIANSKIQVKVGLKDKNNQVVIDKKTLEDAKLVNAELKKRIYPSNYTIGNVNLVKVLSGLMKNYDSTGDESSVTNTKNNKQFSLDFSNHAEASEIIRKKLDNIQDKTIGHKHAKDFNTSRNYAISKITRKHTILYRNSVLRQLYSHRLRFTGMSVFTGNSVYSKQQDNQNQQAQGQQQVQGDINNIQAEDHNINNISESSSVFSLEETITASDDSNNIQHLQEFGDNPVISNIITTNTNFPQINTVSTSKTGTSTTAFEVPTVNVNIRGEKERKLENGSNGLEVIVEDNKQKTTNNTTSGNNKAGTNKNKVTGTGNVQGPSRIIQMTSMGGLNNSLTSNGGNSDSDVFTRIDEFTKVIEQRKKDRRELRKAERLKKYSQSRSKAMELFSNPDKISEEDPLYRDLLDDLENLNKMSNNNTDKFGNDKDGVSNITNVLTKPLSLYATIEEAVKKLVAKGSTNKYGEGINCNRELYVKYNTDGTIKSVYGFGLHNNSDNNKNSKNNKGNKANNDNNNDNGNGENIDNNKTGGKMEKTKALAEVISSIVGLRASLVSAQGMRQQLDEGMGVTSGTVNNGINSNNTGIIGTDISNIDDTTGTSGKMGMIGLAYQVFQGGLGTGGIAKYMVPIRQIVFAILNAIENGSYNKTQQGDEYTLYFDVPIVFKVLIKLIDSNESEAGISDELGGTISDYVTWLASQLCAYVDSYITSTSITAGSSSSAQYLQIISNQSTTCCDLINILRKIQCDLDKESIYGTLGQNNQISQNNNDPKFGNMRNNKLSFGGSESGQNDIAQMMQNYDGSNSNNAVDTFLLNNKNDKNNKSISNKDGNDSINNLSNKTNFKTESNISSLWKILLGENITSAEASKFISDLLDDFVGINQDQQANLMRANQSTQDNSKHLQGTSNNNNNNNNNNNSNNSGNGNTSTISSGANGGGNTSIANNTGNNSINGNNSISNNANNMKMKENMDENNQSQISQGGAGLIVPPRPPCLETLLTLPKGALLAPVGGNMFNGNVQTQSMTNPVGIEAGSVLGYTLASNGSANVLNAKNISVNSIANSFVDVMTSTVVPVSKQADYNPISPPLYGRTTSRSRPSRVLQDAGRVPPRMLSLGNSLLNSLVEQSTLHLFKLSPLAISDLAKECASCALAIRCRLLVGRLSRMWRETCIEIDTLQSYKNGGSGVSKAAIAAALRIRRMRVRWISCIIRAMGRFGPAGVLAVLKGVAQVGKSAKQINFFEEVMNKESRTPLNKMSALDISNLLTQCFETAINPDTNTMKKVKEMQNITKNSNAAKPKTISRRALFESGVSATSLRQRISSMKPRHV